MKVRSLVLLSVLLCALPAAGGLATTPFRIEWSQSGSMMTLKLQDIDKTDMPIDVPIDITIEGVHGKVALPRAAYKDSMPLPLQPGQVIPPIFLRSDSWLTGEMTLIATVTPKGGTTVSASKPVTLQPRTEWAILAAIVGAVAWSIYAFFADGKRTWLRFLGSILLGVFAGLVAFVTANFDVLWKTIGINSANFQVQTYFLLGLVIAYRGVPWTLARFSGDSDAKPLRPSEVKDEIIRVIESDAVIRKPLREEIQNLFLIDGKYLRTIPDLIGRIESSLIQAKYGDIVEGLSDYLQPRLDQLYTISHRESLHTDLVIEIGADWFDWSDTTGYNFVRNLNDKSEEAEVRYAHVEDVPMALQSQPKEKLETLGTMVKEIRLSVSTDDGGELVYQATEGNVLRRIKASKGLKADDSIPLSLSYSDKKQELSFRYEFRLPKPFSERRRVHIVSFVRWLGKAEDGIYSVGLARLTSGYHLSYSFQPQAKSDRVLFQWKSLVDQYMEDEKQPGIIDLPGWLLPGNGICISWNGTNSTRGVVSEGKVIT